MMWVWIYLLTGLIVVVTMTRIIHNDKAREAGQGKFLA